MTKHIPDPRKYQQIALGGPTGNVDCTAWGGAYRVDAHSAGQILTSGRQIRLHSNEPVPDPASPGLSLAQVDASIIDVTNGRVNLDTRVQDRALTRADLKFRVLDGRFCGLSVYRGVLVDRGLAEGFRGAHDITIFTNNRNELVMFDSLVPRLLPMTFDAAFDAATALTPGYIYSQMTRDLSPDYRWILLPDPPAKSRQFYRFAVTNGQIVGMALRQTAGTDVRCTAPRWYPGAGAQKDRYLVRIIAPGQNRDGWYVNARYAEEMVP